MWGGIGDEGREVEGSKVRGVDSENETKEVGPGCPPSSSFGRLSVSGKSFLTTNRGRPPCFLFLYLPPPPTPFPRRVVHRLPTSSLGVDEKVPFTKKYFLYHWFMDVHGSSAFPHPPRLTSGHTRSGTWSGPLATSPLLSGRRRSVLPARQVPLILICLVGRVLVPVYSLGVRNLSFDHDPFGHS